MQRSGSIPLVGVALANKVPTVFFWFFDDTIKSALVS
nr:MAG TPA: hypothetical protein [Caudoviricetes sp.]